VCGLVGFLYRGTAEHQNAALLRMTRRLTHRGPDDEGLWTDATVGVALGHRRLAILDLSPAGHQPMVSASGRYVIVFNGEIYNHLELREELSRATYATDPSSDCGQRGDSWRGHSDTETLLAAFDAWGIEATLKKLVGMFAIALWDRDARTLTLARDRMGEKPLYYGRVRGALVFGSELKALRAFPAFDNPINREALALFMRFAYVPTPWSIYEGIYKLPPGCWVQFPVSPALSSTCERGEVKTYWSVREVAEGGLAEPFCGDEVKAAAELEQLLRQSIANQMIADVPLGAFLSGGIDSSVVVALMQAQSSRPLQTFSIGFHEAGYNEAEHAEAVARHLGTEHTELYVTPAEAQAVIPMLSTLYDEPFADSSQIPTFLVAQLSRRHVTVALSGDGGDELFGGYNRYFLAARIWRRIRMLPLPARILAARVIGALSPAAWNRVFATVSPALPERLSMRLAGDKLHKLAGLLDKGGDEAIYRYLVSFWQDEAIVLGTKEPKTVVTDCTQWLSCPDFEQRMMYLDATTFLPDDILVKVDRASMGVSLEARVPLLDHRIVEFAWRLPLSMKIRDGQGKWLLRQVLYKYVPRELIDRPKMGFGIPIDEWLRGSLNEWAEDLLSEDRLRREGYLDPAPIRAKWAEHLSGKRNWAYPLWNVLMYEAWLNEQGV